MRNLTLMEEHRLGVLRGRCGPKMEEVIGAWGKLRTEKIHNLYFPANTVTVIKSRLITKAEKTAWTAEIRNTYIILVGRPEGKIPLEDLGVNVRIILEWILQK